MKIGDIAFVAVSLVFAVLLYWLTDYAVKNLNTKFRLLYLFPAIIGMAFIAIFGFEWSMLGAYAGVLLLASGFFRDAPKIRKWSVLISACLTGISVLICLMNPFYRADNYVDDFKEAVSEMKKHYVLTAEKEIDFDALYETYLPQFEEAYKKQDAVLNAAAWIQFTREFDDMHVDFSTEDADVLSAAYDRLFGNDYGLALMTLSDGRTVAVNVEENSEAKAAADLALSWLSEHQESDGGFCSSMDTGTESSESCAQVLTALCSLGIDPQSDSRFIKNGNTVLDNLMSFRQEDGGFVHAYVYDASNPASIPDESDFLAGGQAAYALTAFCRYKNNMKNLFNLRPEKASLLSKNGSAMPVMVIAVVIAVIAAAVVLMLKRRNKKE